MNTLLRMSWLLAMSVSPAMAFDVLKLEDEPEPLKCRIDGLGDSFIVARVAIEANGKTRTR